MKRSGGGEEEADCSVFVREEGKEKEKGDLKGEEVEEGRIKVNDEG